MGSAVLEGAGVVSIFLFEPQNVEQGISHDEVRDAVANEKRDLPGVFIGFVARQCSGLVRHSRNR